MITLPPPTECHAPVPMQSKDIAAQYFRTIAESVYSFKEYRKIGYDTDYYVFKTAPNPIYIPYPHTKQTYRSQQRKAKRNKK